MSSLGYAAAEIAPLSGSEITLSIKKDALAHDCCRSAQGAVPSRFIQLPNASLSKEVPRGKKQKFSMT